MNNKILLLLWLTFVVTSTVNGQINFDAVIGDAADRYVSKKKNHGLVIGIIQDGQSEIRGFGQLAKDHVSPPDENTLFEIGSISSVFTTSLMMMESLDGRFDIGDRVQDHLPENIRIPTYTFFNCTTINDPSPGSGVETPRMVSCYPDPFTPDACITFCDLASHTAGLRNSPRGLYSWNPFKRLKQQKNPYKDYTTEELLAKMPKYDLFYAPGVTYHYSNVGVALLGNILAEINKMSYNELLCEQLINPMGLTDTRISLTPEQKQRLAPGHNRKGKVTEHWHFEGMAPAAGLKSSAADLVAFIEANLQDGDGKFSDAFEQVHQARLDVIDRKIERPTMMGYGWFTSTLSKASNLPVIWQNGGTGGFRAFVGFIKSRRTGVVILSNSANAVDGLGFDILERLTSQTPGFSEATSELN